MNRINKNKIENILKKITWDYNVEPYDLYLVLMGEKKTAGPFTLEKIFLRMLERLFWYDLLDIVGIDFIKNNLSKKTIEKIRFRDLKEKYELVRKILHGEALSFSGWSAEYRQKIEPTLLSNRWYRTGKVLF